MKNRWVIEENRIAWTAFKINHCRIFLKYFVFSKVTQKQKNIRRKSCFNFECFEIQISQRKAKKEMKKTLIKGQKTKINCIAWISLMYRSLFQCSSLKPSHFQAKEAEKGSSGFKFKPKRFVIFQGNLASQLVGWDLETAD